MKGRPQDFMSVGIVHFSAFPEAAQGEGPILETLGTLCDDEYFQAVEVTAIRDAAVREQAIRRVRDSGKKAAFAAQPLLLAGGYDLNSLDPEKQQAALDAVRALLPQAKEWDACGLEILSGPDPGEPLRADAKCMLCASLKILCEFSRRVAGPPILLEVFDRVPFGKNRLLGPSEEAADMADRVHPFCRDFGLIMDLSHIPLLGETPERALKAAPQDLRHVHVGNCVLRDKNHPAYGDNHPLFGIPEGENGADQLADFLKVLIEIRYIAPGKRNIVSFEIKPFGGQSAADVIANAKETLDAAWKSL